MFVFFSSAMGTIRCSEFATASFTFIAYEEEVLTSSTIFQILIEDCAEVE